MSRLPHIAKQQSMWTRMGLRQWLGTLAINPILCHLGMLYRWDRAVCPLEIGFSTPPDALGPAVLTAQWMWRCQRVAVCSKFGSLAAAQGHEAPWAVGTSCGTHAGHRPPAVWARPGGRRGSPGGSRPASLPRTVHPICRASRGVRQPGGVSEADPARAEEVAIPLRPPGPCIRRPRLP